MPNKSDKYAINNEKLDKRVKLTAEDKIKIKEEYETGSISMRQLATKYGVSRRSIQFAVYPERLEIVKQQYKERRKDGRYYDKQKHTEAIRKHRHHKKELYEQGLLHAERNSDNGK